MITDYGNCYLCGKPIIGFELGHFWDDSGNEVHEKCRIEEIQGLAMRVEKLRKPDPTIQITSDGLEPELEKIMFNLIERAQIRAHEEGLRYLLGQENFELLDAGAAAILADFHIKMAGPSRCYICDKLMGNDIDTFFVDANGNIVHEICYRGEVIKND